MIRRFALLALAALALALTQTTLAQTTQSAQARSGAAPVDPPAAPSPSPSPSPSPAQVQVLVLGNSLSYVNDLAALLDALDAAQPGPPKLHAELLAEPGGSIADRWKDGVAARELATGRWQVLVLQERGGILACVAKVEQRSEPECQASIAAHRAFATLAKQHGVRVLLLGTWGPDAIWQSQLSRGLHQVAGMTGASIVDAGAMLRAKAKAHPELTLTVDRIGHPSLDGSLLVAQALYPALAGGPAEAIDFDVAAALLPPRARVSPASFVSTQGALRGDGTVTHVTAARLRAVAPAAE